MDLMIWDLGEANDGIDQFLEEWGTTTPSMAVVSILAVSFVVSVLLCKGYRLQGPAGGLTRSSRRNNNPLKSDVSFFLLITKAARNEQCSKDNLSSKYQFLSRQKKIFRIFISDDGRKGTKMSQIVFWVLRIFLLKLQLQILVLNFWHSDLDTEWIRKWVTKFNHHQCTCG